jgi:predicted phage-related endonuclease
VTLHQGATFQHPEHHLCLATPDYLVDIGGARKVLEIKSVYSYAAAMEWGAHETDEIPQKFLCQVMWQLGVCRLDSADVARFYSGAVHYWRVRFDAAMFRDLREIALDWFERHVTKGIDCEPGAPDLEMLKKGARTISDEKAKPEIATPAEAQLLQRWRTAYFDVKAAEERADDAAVKVLNAIGVRTGLQHEKILVRYGARDGKRTVNWLGLARKLGATPEDVVEFTSRGAAYRAPWCSFWNEKEKR